MRYPANLLIAVAGSLALAACGGQPRLANIPSAGKPKPRGPVSDWPVKIGNPYQVLGQWYYPKDEAAYDQSGIASWYGPGFHGLSTANGEAYDMDMLSAAHKTLPLPSYVEVSNLENGRKLVVRVNDRGPFVSDRIIDLSRRSAEVLGIKEKGTARVRVRRVYPPESVRMALRDGRRPPATQMAAVTTAIPPVVPRAAPVASQPAASAQVFSPKAMPEPALTGGASVTLVDLPASSATAGRTGATPQGASGQVAASFASPHQSFIQVAAVSDPGRASWLAAFLKPFGTPMVQQTASGLIRVRIGPYASQEAAQAALAKVRDAGYQDARIVTDDSAG